MKDRISISVLVRTYNSEKTLPRLLNRLDLEPGDEIVVADSGSTDRTLAVAEEHHARVIHVPPPFNYSKSLNAGFRASNNPWVLVVSSHSVPLVSDLLGVFRLAVTGFPFDAAVGYGPNTLQTRTNVDKDPTVCFRGGIPKKYFRLCGNGNALYRRAVWQQYPFDESIRTGEDKAWLAIILTKNLQVAFIPSARTINLSVYGLKYMFNKGASDRRAASLGLMSLKGLIYSLGSHTKLFLDGSMPVGNWIRYSAHILGQFLGSYQKPHNEISPQ